MVSANIQFATYLIGGRIQYNSVYVCACREDAAYLTEVKFAVYYVSESARLHVLAVRPDMLPEHLRELPAASTVCECGVDKAGVGGLHSDWCPKAVAP